MGGDDSSVKKSKIIDKQQGELIGSLREAVDDVLGVATQRNVRVTGALVVDAFFRRWYRSTTFVFRKNIKVTNVQFRELLSLLKLHSVNLAYVDNVESEHVLYQTSKEMKITFRNLWDTLNVIPDGNGDPIWYLKCEKLASTYPEFFFDTILVDGFCGSAQVHRPRCLEIDLAKVCGESGYIYSCGTTIYVRRPARVSVPAFRKKIADYLRSKELTTERIPFVIFSREQFPTHSVEDVRRSEHNGLDDLKFHMDKFYFGDAPVSDLHRSLFLADESESFEENASDNSELLTSRAVYWRDRHNSERRPDGGDQTGSNCSIFLMMDRPISLGEPSVPTGRYFVTFVQEFTNRSQLIEFEESKPGWTAPATIPHSLCAAMLNIARAGLNRSKGSSGKESLRILDLFCGSGTTMLEAAKLPELESFLGVDKYGLNRQAAMDNLAFFTLPIAEKKRLYSDLTQEILSGVDPLSVWRFNPATAKSGDKTSLAFEKFSPLCDGDWHHYYKGKSDELFSVQKKLTWAFTIASHEFEFAKEQWQGAHTYNMFRTLSSHETGPELIELLSSSKLGLVSRLLFYTCWKSLLSSAYELWAVSEADEGTTLESYQALMRRLSFNEIGKLAVRLGRMIWIEESPPLADRAAGTEGLSGRDVDTDVGIALTHGLYSTKVSIKIDGSNSKVDYQCRDVKDLVLDPAKKFNIIVTDPPYGFNVTGEGSELPDLYRKMMLIMLQHIENGGQILFCVPQAPMNGQKIPFYMTAEFIVKQFILIASHAGKRLVDQVIKYPGGATTPISDHYYRPPYYWESERALRRAVLHFQVFDNI
jgi:tRNA G10  N-methylase Trm11